MWLNRCGLCKLKVQNDWTVSEVLLFFVVMAVGVVVPVLWGHFEN